MKIGSRRNVSSLVVSFVLVLAATLVHAGQTARVSVDSTGDDGSGDSFASKISADGRFVVFVSGASNLVPGDTNATEDVFVRDRSTGQTIRVSVDSAGEEGNNYSSCPSISADGRHVAFMSEASNLVAGDTNNEPDVFVHDRKTGQTTRISVSSAGVQGVGNIMCLNTSISADGRFVAFVSGASNLVRGDTNKVADVFVRDRSTGITTRVSVDSAGVQGNQWSHSPSISADGLYVAFVSRASNFVADDTNNCQDVFVRARGTGQTARVSVDSAGGQGDDSSTVPSISASGRYIAFSSDAVNLVSGDDNGYTDVFVRDRSTGTTTRVSLESAGGEGNEASFAASISADGHYVVFASGADNLVTDDLNAYSDVFLHDKNTMKTTRISVGPAVSEGNGQSSSPSISADGRYVAFESGASNLVAEDGDGLSDVFVRDRLLQALQADLGVAVTSEPVSVAKGGSAGYTFTVTNNGPTSARAVTLIDVTAIAPTSLTPSQGSCRKAAVSVCRLGVLAAGASATVDVAIKANLDPLTQQVTVGAAPKDSVPDNNSVTVETPVTP